MNNKKQYHPKNVREMKNQDCHFYYYSTCSKGTSCPFRHEPAAMRNETICADWRQGLCTKPHCEYRHMILKKRRDKILCYWESQPAGCQKPHCAFLHKRDMQNEVEGPIDWEDDATDPMERKFAFKDSSKNVSNSKGRIRHLSSSSPTSLQANDNASSCKRLSVTDLAKTLSNCSEYSSTLLNLFDNYGLNHNAVKKSAEELNHVFLMTGEVVTLKPKVAICPDHVAKDGCPALKTCQKLHLCPEYLIGTCTDNGCVFGHFLRSDHNNPILEMYYISSLANSKLFELLSLVTVTSFKDKLKICKDYNAERCLKVKCKKLHLCLAFLGKACDSGSNCKLNHNIMNEEVLFLLKTHGVSTKDSPRDLFILVSNIPSIKHTVDACVPQANSSNSVRDKDDGSGGNSSQLNKSDSTNGNLGINPNIRSDFPNQQAKPVETVWSNNLVGEVVIGEICYNSVESFCYLEKMGCSRLHCNQHFYWQIRELGKHWINLRPYQVLALEKEFCNPEKSVVKLLPLDPASLEPSLRELVLILKGRSVWDANFDSMQLTIPGQNDVLDLRRIASEITSYKLPEPCQFAWYFLDKNNKWIEYGNNDSTGEEGLKCTITSKDIESHMKQTPNVLLTVKNSKFTYTLDTLNMLQTNSKTNVVRKVRRRPRPHIKEEKKVDSYDFPSFWEPMQTEERVRRILLDNSSREYSKVTSYFTKQGGTYNLIKIERVQNPYLWRAFQNKVKEMTSVYKTNDAVNIQQLFHGTSPEIVPKICEENFDWRLHGSNVGQAYGRGTYFSPLPSTSHGYTKPDASGYRYMFIAQVAIGSITQGNSAMARPPINSLTNLPYDSTVNAIQNPSIIVKYDKQEYFPEYILTLK